VKEKMAPEKTRKIFAVDLSEASLPNKIPLYHRAIQALAGLSAPHHFLNRRPGVLTRYRSSSRKCTLYTGSSLRKRRNT
jgi:hypothetical protein